MFEAEPSRSLAMSPHANPVIGSEMNRKDFVGHVSCAYPACGFEKVRSRMDERFPAFQANILNPKIGHTQVVPSIKERRMVQ